MTKPNLTPQSAAGSAVTQQTAGPNELSLPVKLDTERARDELVNGISLISGAAAELRGSTVVVRVQDRFGAVADQVYDLEAEVGRRHPEVELDVLVTTG